MSRDDVEILGNDCRKASLPKYKGANIGGGTGNNDGCCTASLAFKEAAAITAAGVSVFSFDVEVY